jgi:hypothetical protein
MPRPSTPLAAAAILLLALTACVGGASTESTNLNETDPALWARTALGDDEWQGAGASMSAGGLAPGSDAGMSLTPENPGWHRIDMACKGPSSMSVKITGADSEISSGIIPCGAAVRTTVELPATLIDIKVDGANVRGMWAVAMAPTEAP